MNDAFLTMRINPSYGILFCSAENLKFGISRFDKINVIDKKCFSMILKDGSIAHNLLSITGLLQDKNENGRVFVL